jgi:hypothetical protein
LDFWKNSKEPIEIKNFEAYVDVVVRILHIMGEWSSQSWVLLLIERMLFAKHF